MDAATPTAFPATRPATAPTEFTELLFINRGPPTDEVVVMVVVASPFSSPNLDGARDARLGRGAIG